MAGRIGRGDVAAPPADGHHQFDLVMQVGRLGRIRQLTGTGSSASAGLAKKNGASRPEKPISLACST